MKYECPEMTIMQFDCDDVITTSFDPELDETSKIK